MKIRIITALIATIALVGSARAQTLLPLPSPQKTFPLTPSTNQGTVGAWGANLQGQTTIPMGLNGITEIAAGGSFVLALYTNGNVTAWGDNSSGQTNIPNGLSNVVHVAAGQAHSVALQNNGTIIAWGANNSGQSSVPSSITNAVDIAAGADHTVVLKSDGTVAAWGYNGYGQTNVPTGLTNVVQVAAGSEWSLALKSDGTVAAWGENNNAQCQIPAMLTNVVQIAAGGNHNVALLNNGTVVCWGDNSYGQCSVPTGLSNVISIAAGWDHTLAMRSDGSVAAWGEDNSGQSDVPGALRQSMQITAGNAYSAALFNSSFSTLLPPTLPTSFPLENSNSPGTLYGWGNNSSGQTTIPSGTTNALQVISSSSDFTLVLKSDGSILSFGNTYFQGTSWSLNGTTNIFMVAGNTFPFFLNNNGGDGVVSYGWDQYWGGTFFIGSGTWGNNIVQISGSLALSSNGSVTQLVIQTPNGYYGYSGNHPSFFGGGTMVINGHSITNGIVQVASAYSDSLLLQNNGTVLGSGSTAASSVPSCLAGVVQVSVGNGFAAALRTDGSVYVWGDNTYGQTNVPSMATNIVYISAGNHHLIALRSDGSVVAWGDNSYGETTMPVGLSSVVFVAAGDGNSFIIQGARLSPINFPNNSTNIVIGISGQTATNDYVLVDDPINDWVNGVFTNTLFQNLTTAVAVNNGFLNSVATNPAFVSALARTITNSPTTYGVLQQGPQGVQGIQGPQGPQGPVGPMGPAGPQGPIGLTGPAGPIGLQGPAGINGTNGADGPQGPVGPTGPAGTNGLNGINGNTVLSGIGTPASGIGSMGDIYLDTSSNNLFGPKTTYGWGAGTSLVGPQGISGLPNFGGYTAITNGMVYQAPSDGFILNSVGSGTRGQSGYVNLGTNSNSLNITFGSESGYYTTPTTISTPVPSGYYYSVTGNSTAYWLPVVKGALANSFGTLISGSGAPDATNGVVGDLYYDSNSASFYGPKSTNGWGSQISVMGPQGPAGSAGPAGAMGPQGPAGATGPQGPIGLTGPAGPIGLQGPAGINGTNGATGPQGPAGPAGPVGVFDPTVLTNTAFLSGLCSNPVFVSSLATNPAFVTQIAGNADFVASLSTNTGFLSAVAARISSTNGASTSPVTVSNSQVTSNPINWASPSGQRYSAMIYASVYAASNSLVTNAGSLLAVFSGTNCCGVATLGSGPNGPLFQIPVFSDQSEVSNMSFQFYNGLSGQISGLAESYTFNSGSVSGSITQPLSLHLSRTQSIQLQNGWTWISFNVASVDGTWGTMLAGYTGSDNDVILGTEGSVTYYHGVWYASSPSFTPQAGAMYMISCTSASQMTAVGYPSTTPLSASVVNGWNWIGSPDATNGSLQQMFPRLNFSNNDLILSQTGQSSTYYGGVWYNSSGGTNGFLISPGVGYLLEFHGTNQAALQY